MNFRIHVGHGRFPDELDQHVRTRLFFALERFAARLTDVHVRFDDVNGPRGGQDMRCRIEIRLRGAGKLQVEARADDALAAVDQASSRAKRAVARAVDRRTDRAMWRAAS